MKVENALGLPEPIVRAVAYDDYTRGSSDISVSQLTTPPRIVTLMEQHGGELVEDAADRIWLLLGSSIHEILARSGRSLIAHMSQFDQGTGHSVEERLSTECRGWTVSGAFDHLAYTPDGVLDDYKVSSTWSVKNGGKEDWRAQLNLYALLLRRHGRAVKYLRNVVICRDWRKNEFLCYGPPYPAHEVAILEVPLWSDEEQDRYLDARVALHQAARASLPLCTPEDRWQKEHKWALMREGRKTAIKLYDTQAEALAAANGAKGVYVQDRPGDPTRCLQYCSVRQQCESKRDGQWDA